MVRILYFAWIRERVGVEGEDRHIPSDVRTASSLMDWLCGLDSRYCAAFADRESVRVAIDCCHARHDSSIEHAAEIAFFPPMTGG